MGRGDGGRVEFDSRTHRGAEGDPLEIDALGGGRLGPDDGVQDRVHVVLEPLRVEGGLAHRNVDDSRLLRPEFHLAGLRLAHRPRDVRRDRAHLRVRHQPAWPEHLTQASDHAHHVGPGDGVHRCLQRARRHVRHLGLGDLLELLALERPHLLLAGLVRPGALLLLRMQPERLLDQDRGGRRLHHERERPVRVDGDQHRNDQALLGLRLCGRVELLAGPHDVDTVLAQRSRNRRRRIRLPGGKLQLHHSCDLLRHCFSPWSERLSSASHRYVFSTCMKSSSTGVARPKIETSTRTRPLSGFTSSTVPLKFENGPSTTRTLSPSSNSTFAFGFSAPSESCVVSRAISCSLTAGGLVALPTNPVIFGVFFTRCQVRSFSSICTRMYPGKNLRFEARFSPFTISTTFSIGMRMSPKYSSREFCLIFSSSDFFALFSKPEYVWTTYHFLSIFFSSAAIGILLSDSLRCSRSRS